MNKDQLKGRTEETKGKGKDDKESKGGDSSVRRQTPGSPRREKRRAQGRQKGEINCYRVG